MEYGMRQMKDIKREIGQQMKEEEEQGTLGAAGDLQEGSRSSF